MDTSTLNSKKSRSSPDEEGVVKSGGVTTRYRYQRFLERLRQARDERGLTRSLAKRLNERSAPPSLSASQVTGVDIVELEPS